MNIIQQFKLGAQLTRLTNVAERADNARLQGRDLTTREVGDLEAQEKASLEALSRYPRHVVTRELLKNAMLAERMNNIRRRDIIVRLIHALVAEGVALSLPEFEASYM